ncbi:MAG: IPT/TIG domain-containing protein [Bacteroidota bacterium]
MKYNFIHYIFLSLLVTLSVACSKEAPEVVTYSPDFGPAETLITVEGMHFDEIEAVNFNDGVPANFNPSYGTSTALLFRVPENAPLGDNMIKIETKGGVTQFPFRVTLKPPVINDFYPESGDIGDSVVIIGENFFEPLEVLFFDSIAGEVVFLAEDSLVVKVPPGVQKGRIKVKANGGPVQTAKVFFTTTEYLVNDFDGNGLRSETDKWLFYGFIDQTAANAIHNSQPAPISGNFLKITGRDQGSAWIGGTEHHSFDLNVFDVYPIESDINNTFLQFDINNNGRDDTHLIIVLAERNGSPNDFTEQIAVDWDGWDQVQIPLNRFTDLDNLTIDPQKIRTVKFHLINNNGVAGKLEANIDNVKFIQIN